MRRQDRTQSVRDPCEARTHLTCSLRLTRSSGTCADRGTGPTRTTAETPKARPAATSAAAVAVWSTIHSPLTLSSRKSYLFEGGCRPCIPPPIRSRGFSGCPEPSSDQTGRPGTAAENACANRGWNARLTPYPSRQPFPIRVCGKWVVEAAAPGRASAPRHRLSQSIDASAQPSRRRPARTVPSDPLAHGACRTGRTWRSSARRCFPPRGPAPSRRPRAARSFARSPTS